MFPDHLLGEFSRNQRGAVAITFAVILVTLIVAFGAAIDYSRAASTKTTLNIAADSAVLAGVVADESMSASDRQAYVKTWFYAQANDTFGSPSDLTVTIGAPPTGRGVTVSLSYKASVPSTFLKVIGIEEMTMASFASASRDWPPYTDVHVALDVSQSMGLAATAADIGKMLSLTSGGFMPAKPKGCAFACHQQFYGEKTSLFTVARSNGVTLRVDSMRNAVMSVIDAARDQGGSPNPYRFAIYTFRDVLSNLTSLSSDLYAVKADVAKLDLPAPLVPITGETSYAKPLPTLATTVGKAGPGSAASPRKAVFIVTDGVQDTGVGHATGPINPALCDAFKDNGVQVAVIYTTFLAMPTDPDYVSLVKPFEAQIAPKLQACASPGLYFEATDGPSIMAGMLALFAKVSNVPRLTN
jgi:Flp pilus assembly protein TadG